MQSLLESGNAGWVLGLAMLAVAALVAVGLRRGGGGLRRVGLLAIAGILGVLGLALTAGGIASRTGVARDMAAVPIRGSLVDVGGYRIHVLCEGPTRAGAPTLVWISGGNAHGLWLHHLHVMIQGEVRSCLFDRAGTGLSDPGLRPRSMEAQADELIRALEGYGEKGPFVPVGHSMGGMLAVTVAALHPDRIAGVITLDPTAPAHAESGQTSWCGRDIGLAQLVPAIAVNAGLTRVLPGLNPLRSPMALEAHKPLAPIWDHVAALEERPSALIAKVQATTEMCRNPLGRVRLPGSLGDLPLLSIVQPESTPRPEDLIAEQRRIGLTDFEYANYRAIAATASTEVANLSRIGRLERSPPGTGHNFPLEVPDFVIAHVKAFLADLPPRTAPGAEAPR